MRKTILTAALLCAFLGTQAQEYYEKHVAFPAGATTAQKIDMASRLVPTPQQLAWQQMEFTAFLHFGINTFTGRDIFRTMLQRQIYCLLSTWLPIKYHFLSAY